MEPNSIKLLYVDDDKQQLFQTMTWMRNNAKEFNLLAAPSGEAAYNIAQIEIPDIVVMDWTMTNGTGLEALKNIRKNPLTRNIPVIMATALAHPEDIEMAFEEGADDYLKKPFHNLELAVRVKHILKKYADVAALKAENRKLREQIMSLM